MIYFIKHSDYIKIGFTTRIKQRLYDLQVSCPVKLEILGLINGSLENEKQYHNKFKHISISGEWFTYTKELENYIDLLDKELLWKYGFINNTISPIGLIKQTRLQLNWSLEELAEKLNMSKQGVLHMERRDAEGRITINT